MCSFFSCALSALTNAIENDAWSSTTKTFFACSGFARYCAATRPSVDSGEMTLKTAEYLWTVGFWLAGVADGETEPRCARVRIAPAALIPSVVDGPTVAMILSFE